MFIAIIIKIRKKPKQPICKTTTVVTNEYGGKFLKKLCCCVGGSFTRQFGFIN